MINKRRADRNGIDVVEMLADEIAAKIELEERRIASDFRDRFIYAQVAIECTPEELSRIRKLPARQRALALLAVLTTMIVLAAAAISSGILSLPV